MDNIFAMFLQTAGLADEAALSKALSAIKQHQ